MSTPPWDPQWPQALAETLHRWALRRQRIQAARRLGWAVTVTGVLLAVAMVLDLAGDPRPWLRVAVAAAALLGVVIGAGLALRRLLAGWSYADAARGLEQAAGLAGEPLSGPLFLTARPVPGYSPWMIGRALALAAVAADTIDVRRLLPWRPAVPALAGAACTLLILGAASFADPTLRAATVRALLPWRELPAPGDQLLVVEPGDAWLAPGSELVLSVRDQQVPLTAELEWADGGGETRALERRGALQRLAIAPLHRDLRWRVRGPGLASAWRTATIVAVPRLASLVMHVAPPGYTGLPDEQVQGGDATVIAGSDAAIDLVLEGPAAATAALVTDDREIPLPLTRSPYGGQFGSARLRVTADLSWHIRLIIAGGPGGVVVDLPQRWHLNAVTDLAPSASATVDAALVPAGRAVRIAVTAADDVALASVWLELSGEGAAEPVRLALPVPAGTRRLEAAAVVVPADLAAHPGDRLSVVPVARDRAGSETRGTPVAIVVAQAAHANRHDLVARLDQLVAAATTAAEAASESEKSWRAAARAWRPEDPAAGAAGLRAAAGRARSLAAAATVVADGAEAAAMLGGAPGNLQALSIRAVAVAGGALALAARSAPAEAGSTETVAGAGDAAAELVRNAAALADSTALAASAAEASAATADLEAARDQLAGANAVLTAERAWTSPDWQTGLLGTFWRGSEPGTGEAVFRHAELPAVDGRDVPGIGANSWCARWEGQVLLPEAGRWTFRCTADDGVRLRIGGRDILPADSWRDQGATAYLGSLELPAGWHPIAIDYYQGVGDSHLQVEAGRGEPVALDPERLRHRAPPDPRARHAMTALPAGAAEAASARARHAGEDAQAAAALLHHALGRVVGRDGLDDLAKNRVEVSALIQPLAAMLDWSDSHTVDTATAAVAAAAERALQTARRLREACRNDGRGAGSGGLAERLREAAGKPDSKAAQQLAGDLARERTAFAALAADGLLDPARRASALAAAWSIDVVLAALAGNDADATRAAVAAASPSLGLAARHARAAEAAAGVARQSDALLAELAVSPGWPPGLLRPARDLLRQAAADLRAGEDSEQAARLASEVAHAVELEALRPGSPPSEALTAAITWLRDQTVQPQAEALAEIADLLEHVDRGGSLARPQPRILAAAAAARRTAAMAALAESATALAATAPALLAAGQPELAERATVLAGQAHALASAPDQASAQSLATALADSLATPLAIAVTEGRLEPGSPAAQAGRVAARTAAAATTLATLPATAASATGEDEDEDESTRSNDRVAAEAASAAAAIDFPEEHRAAIRAYLRRIGAPR